MDSSIPSHQYTPYFFYLMTSSQEIFSSWDDVYKYQAIETMSWYNENLDTDLEEELEKRKTVNCNTRFLDLGTGAGTQAIQLVKRRYKVIGTDISETAIHKARELQSRDHNKNKYSNSNIDFIVDDILNSKLKDGLFDYVFDRGCFHVIASRHRKKYVSEIERILDNKGILFLKCLSIKDPFLYMFDPFRIKEQKQQQEEVVGPYKFSENQIKDIFGKNFTILTIKDTVIQGMLEPLPCALFVVMEKR